MSEHDDNQADPALKRLLTSWGPAPVPPGLDERVLTSYRRQQGVRPFWHSFFLASVRVPLPVAVALAVLLIVSTALALRPATGRVQEAEADPIVDSTRAARAVEVPVVTHTDLSGFGPATGADAAVVLEGAP